MPWKQFLKFYRCLEPYRFLVLSFIVHALLAALVLNPWKPLSQPAPSPQNVTISLIERSKGNHGSIQAPKGGQRGAKQAPKAADEPRPALNSKDFAPGKVPMDVLLTGNEYVARVKALVEPRLIRLLRARTKELKGARQKAPKCSSEVLVVLDSGGNYLSITQTEQCTKDPEFNSALKNAFLELKGLPRPPSNLLQNGRVEMYWRLIVQ